MRWQRKIHFLPHIIFHAFLHSLLFPSEILESFQIWEKRVTSWRSRGVLNQVSQKRSTSRMTQVSRMCVSLWSQFDIVANSFLPVPCRYRGVEPGVRRDPSPAHHRRHHHRAGSLPPLWTPGGAHRPPHCPLKSHSAPPAGPCAPLHLNVTHSKDTLISLQNTSTL